MGHYHISVQMLTWARYHGRLVLRLLHTLSHEAMTSIVMAFAKNKSVKIVNELYIWISPFYLRGVQYIALV